MSAHLTARQITGVARSLFPHVRPLATSRDLSSNGLVLSYTLTMPEPAARNWGVTRLADARGKNAWLSRQLGTTVHVFDVYATPRRDGSRLVHVVIKRGEEGSSRSPGPRGAEPAGPRDKAVTP